MSIVFTAGNNANARFLYFHHLNAFITQCNQVIVKMGVEHTKTYSIHNTWKIKQGLKFYEYND